MTIGGKSFRLRRQLLADLARHKMSEYLAALDRPLLILHSPQDEIIDIGHAERLFREASHPKSFISVDGADHLLTARSEDWQFVAAVIEDWAKRYLIGEDRRSHHGPDEVERG